MEQLGKTMRKMLVLIVRLWLTAVVLLQCTAAVAQPNQNENENAPRKIIIAVAPTPPYCMQDEDGTWFGITVDLWKEIAAIIGTPYEFKTTSLSSLLRLTDRNYDVAVLGVSITADREKRFDFSDPYLAAVEGVAVNSDREPNLFDSLRSTFLNVPMLLFVLSLCAISATGGFILWLIEHRGTSEHYAGRTKQALYKSMFWSTMVMIGREFPKAVGWSINSPSTFAGRLFALIWVMLGVLMISVFTAVSASLMTSKQLQGLVKDANDLRHVRVGTVMSSVGEEYLKHHHIRITKTYKSPQEMLAGLAKHDFDAAVYNRHTMVYYARTDYAGKIKILPISLRQDFLAIPMRTGFPQREQVNEALLQILESRQWQDIVSKYLGNDWINSDAKSE